MEVGGKSGCSEKLFPTRAMEGGGRYVKPFILVRHKHQYRNIDDNTSYQKTATKKNR